MATLTDRSPASSPLAPGADVRLSSRNAASLSYRPEIDGLRAVAVVPVVLFHAGMHVFSGGFIGVDVFFVISGYLITAILLNDIAQERYSIARFYERRARRILPALLLVMLACLPAAWFGLLPTDFRQFSISILSVLGFVSNISFWREEGYFSTASELKPLLHTWSLAVEEQFYLALPLLLFLLRKASRRTLTIVLGAAALGSFALCEFAAFRFPTANFYLAPTRAWELLGGSLCALWGRHHDKRWSNVLSWLGLGLILIAVFLFDGTLQFPSHYALVPVGGAMLLITFARPGGGAGRLLSLPPLLGIGLISYSLYLWHQPLFAFARQYSSGVPPRGLMLALAALSVVLAWASWRWIETPFRHKGDRTEVRRSLSLAGAAIALLVAFAGYGLASGGTGVRLRETGGADLRSFIATAQRPSHTGGDCIASDTGFTTPCVYVPAPAGAPRIALFGDSHGEALLPAFAELARQKGMQLHFASIGGCPPLLGAYVINGWGSPAACPTLAKEELTVVKAEKVGVVFLAGRWPLYTDGEPSISPSQFLLAREPWPFRPTRAASREALSASLADTVAAYRAAGVRVVLIDDVPPQDFALDRFVKWMAYKAETGGPTAAIARTAVSVPAADAVRAPSRLMLYGLAGPGVVVANLDATFRRGDRYVWGNGKESWYFDSNHLSDRGAAQVVPQLAAALDQALAR